MRIEYLGNRMIRITFNSVRRKYGSFEMQIYALIPLTIYRKRIDGWGIDSKPIYSPDLLRFLRVAGIKPISCRYVTLRNVQHIGKITNEQKERYLAAINQYFGIGVSHGE